jgi:hypothetical protein
MGFRADLRDGLAQASLDILRELGTTCTYSGSDRSVEIYCDPGAEQRTYSEVLGAMTDTTTRTFSIPMQTDFPPENGVAIADRIEFEDFFYVVDEWSDASGGIGALYEIKGTRTQANVLGVVGKKGRK